MQRSPRKYPSNSKLILFAVVSAFGVLSVSLLVQILVYDDWLHHTGPLRVIGSSMAAVLTFVFVVRWQLGVRQQQREMIARFEQIARMNDRIRNALQAIELVVYAAQSPATGPVREAVEVIDAVLLEVLADAGHFRKPVAASPNTIPVSAAKGSGAA